MSRVGSDFRSASKIDTLIILILMILLVVTPLAGGVERGPMVWLVHTLVFGLLLLWGFDIISRGRVSFVHTSLDYPIFIFVILSVTSALFSVSASRSFLTLLNFFDYIALYYLVANKVRLKDTQRVSLIIYAIIAAGSLAALAGIIIYLRSSAEMLKFTYDNPNPFGAYLAMVIPVALVMMMTVADVGKKILIGYGICIMMVALALTLSKGAWGSLLCALGLMACLYQYNRYNLSKPSSLYLSSPYLFSILLVIGVILLLIVLFGYVEVRRELIGLADRGRIESVSGRVPIWRGTWDIVCSYPLLGAGPGTFPLLFDGYVKKYSGNLQDRYAHSEYLQTVSEWGGFSLLIILWIQVSFFLAAARVYMRAKSRRVQQLVLGIIGSMSAISIHSLVEFALHPMANAIICVVLGGLVAGGSARG